MRKHELLLGFLLATALWSVVLTLNSDSQGNAHLNALLDFFNKRSELIIALAIIAIILFTLRLTSRKRRIVLRLRKVLCVARQAMRKLNKQLSLAAMTSVLLAVWAVITLLVGQDIRRKGLHDALKDWQTLFAAGIAIIAACIAWWNTDRQIKHAAELERQRRSQKQSALRSVLPLALSELATYATHSLGFLEAIYDHISDSPMPEGPSLPVDTIDVLTNFIEYSDGLNVDLFTLTLARIQVQHSWFPPRSSTRYPGGRAAIDDHIVLSGIIFASLLSAFYYARGETKGLPEAITWQDVRLAIHQVGPDLEKFKSAFALIDDYERRGASLHYVMPWFSLPPGEEAPVDRSLTTIA